MVIAAPTGVGTWLLPPFALAADPSASIVIPSPTAAAYASADASAEPPAAGDPRSSGEGAGLVGAPLVAIGGVLAIGVLAAAGTLAYVRFTGGPRRD